ncbi:MAG: dut [Friedmanniella sp.]|nr:dut [Friedmanniella sp.]
MSHGVRVLLQRLDPGLEPPAYARPGDAGADLRTTEDFELAPGERRVVGTGVAIALPVGYAAFVHPRSGLAARHGVTVVNTPGTVDAGYRGEILVCLLNTDRVRPVAFARGDRIAQLVVQPVSRAVFVAVPALPESVRGIDGYGSTGGILGVSSATPVTDVGRTAEPVRQEPKTMRVPGEIA